ncbi:MAG: alpha-L-fucosidase [Thermoguttaceae bacterium]
MTFIRSHCFHVLMPLLAIATSCPLADCAEPTTNVAGQLSGRGAERTPAAPPATDADSFAEMHLGLFVHYTYVGKPYRWGSTLRANGDPVRSLDELADDFDAENLAACAAAMRAQYVQFTTWHANMNALYPSKAIERRLPGHCSRRDVIADLIRALRARNIRLILYIHPSDGDDFSREDQQRVGWNDPPPYARWNDFINEVVAELADRYGRGVSGYYIDGGLPPQVDAPRLRQTILKRQPKAWLIQNSGLNRACVDYASREKPSADPPFPATTWQMASVVTGLWWAQQGRVSVRPEAAYQYTILQAAVSGRTGGGVAWSFGPHPRGKWESGVNEFTGRLGTLVGRAGPSLFGARPSRAYVTNEWQLLQG